jgi:hypothetical protein
MPVQEENGWTASPTAYADPRFAGVDELELETFEHGRA